MNYVSTRLLPVKASASAAVSQAARAARSRGEDIIDLGLGEPDFDTPAHIIEAANQAAQDGQTRYTLNEGTPELRTAVAAKFLRDNKLDYALSEIIVCNGAKQVIFNALMASLETGDEVLLCAPYFGQYKDIALILGGEPRAIPCAASNGFKLTADALDAAITDKTRWLFLNLPSNPAGAVYTEQDLTELGEVLDRYPAVLILSDEIYEHILFDGREHLSLAAVCPQLKDRILTVNGVSKAYAMTGWRVGYCGGPQMLIKAMTTVQSQISSGVCAIAQAAAVAALNGPQNCVKQFCDAFESRRNLIVDKIAGIDASVPGSAYELSPFFRISTATSEEILSQAMDRLADCTKKLTRH